VDALRDVVEAQRNRKDTSAYHNTLVKQVKQLLRHVARDMRAMSAKAPDGNQGQRSGLLKNLTDTYIQLLNNVPKAIDEKTQLANRECMLEWTRNFINIVNLAIDTQMQLHSPAKTPGYQYLYEYRIMFNSEFGKIRDILAG